MGAGDQAVSNIALKKILINLRDLNERIKSIFGYYNSKSYEAPQEKNDNYEYSKFCNPPGLRAAYIFRQPVT